MRALRALPRLIRELILPGALLGGVGLVAVAVSGLLAGLMAAAFGGGFVSGDMPGVTYTPARCAELFRLAPAASDCEAAAVVHHLDEIVTYRIAAGVVGLLALAVWLVLRRYRSYVGILPERFVETVGLTLFGAAACALLAEGAARLAVGAQTGAGASLSGGIVAAVVAVAFLVRFLGRVPGSRGLSGGGAA